MNQLALVHRRSLTLVLPRQAPLKLLQQLGQLLIRLTLPVPLRQLALLTQQELQIPLVPLTSQLAQHFQQRVQLGQLGQPN